jgi:TusA-related sulfurtransferase
LSLKALNPIFRYAARECGLLPSGRGRPNTLAGEEEKRIIARGLSSPGPLLLVRKRLDEFRGGHLRVIVSTDDSADELVDFFMEMGAKVEIDHAGTDIHVVVDLTESGE